jgi:hypothetical protein
MEQGKSIFVSKVNNRLYDLYRKGGRKTMEDQQISYSNSNEERHNHSDNINLYEKFLDEPTKNGIFNFIKRLSYSSPSKETKNE